MPRSRINLMVMTSDAPESPIRSYTLPGYLPRALLIAGIIAAILLVSGAVMTIYYIKSIGMLATLQAENNTLRESAARIDRLQAELEYHRSFTRRVAGLLGISIPAFADSAAAVVDRASPGTTSPSNGGETPGWEEGLPIPGLLVTECPPDPNNRPRGMPVHGPISRSFAPEATNPDLRHTGVDFAVREGTPVLATADGSVTLAGEDELYGFIVRIDHGNGFATMYGHNSVILVRTGETVRRGDRIAFSGNTGISTAPHLHYEITENGRPVDPAGFLGR